MHVCEVVLGMGKGGAEIGVIERLKRAPNNIKTTLIVIETGNEELIGCIDQSKTELVLLKGRLTRSARLMKIIGGAQPDVVISHNPQIAVLLLANKLRGNLTPPVVCVAHNSLASEVRWKNAILALSLFLLNPQAILHIADSKAAADGVQCKRAQRTVVNWVGSTVDHQAIALGKIWPDGVGIRLCTLSRFSTQKNLHALLWAVKVVKSELIEARAHLALIGEGPLEGSLRRQIDQEGLHDVASVHPWSPTSGVLQAADRLIITSSHEGGPLTLFEALQMGTSVMSTRVGAAPDLLTDQDGNLLISGTDIGSIVWGLQDIIAIEGRAKNLRPHRSEKFAALSSKQCSERHYRLLEGVVGWSG